MRIAMLVGRFPVLSETFVINQVVGVLERGHEVDVYATYGLISDEGESHPDVDRFALRRRAYTLPDVPVPKLTRLRGAWNRLWSHGWSHPRPLARALNPWRYGRQASSLYLLYKSVPLLDRGPYDIIHSQFGTHADLARNLRQIVAPKAKLITTFRGLDISKLVQSQGPSLYRKLFEEGDYFLANCEFFRQRAIALGCDPERIEVLRSGIRCERFTFQTRQREPGQPFQIAMIGRLVEKKGTEYAIRAMAQLVKRGHDARFTIIGEGPLRGELTALIQTLGLSQVVDLVGEKREHEIIDILNKTQLFVAPSVTAADGDQDAPINVLKEAMAMGLPVVSTLHGGIPELVEEGVSGYLVPERDAEALADRLDRLIRHPERWEAMGTAGRECVLKNYNIQTLNDRLVAIYQKVLGS